MGKIFDALEKSKKEEKPEPGVSASHSEPGAGATPTNRGIDSPELPSGGEGPLDFVGAGTVFPATGGEVPEPEPPSPPQASPPPELPPRTTREGVKQGALDKNLITLFKQHTVAAEQFRMLKTKLLFPESGKPPRTVMVTSAFPGEGKTFVASNLAVSIAQSLDEYVLLMDCDMRLPSVHSRFGYKSIPGLSEYLGGSHSLSDLLVKSGVDKLTLLPGGTPPPNPSELLSSIHMAKLFEEVKGRYKDRYIIVDSPPPRLTAESRALAMQVDGIVLVVKNGNTSRENLQELTEIIGKDKILGVVFNYFNGGTKFGRYGDVYSQYYGGISRG